MRAHDRHDLPDQIEPSHDEKAICLAQSSTHVRVEQLGWSRADAADVRARLQSFADDWDDPTMDVYDAL